MLSHVRRERFLVIMLPAMENIDSKQALGSCWSCRTPRHDTQLREKIHTTSTQLVERILGTRTSRLGHWDAGLKNKDQNFRFVGNGKKRRCLKLCTTKNYSTDLAPFSMDMRQVLVLSDYLVRLGILASRAIYNPAVSLDSCNWTDYQDSCFFFGCCLPPHS